MNQSKPNQEPKYSDSGEQEPSDPNLFMDEGGNFESGAAGQQIENAEEGEETSETLTAAAQGAYEEG